MSVHWGGKGPGHVSRWPKAVGPVNTYSGATMLLDFLNPVLDPRITFSRGTGATRVNQSGFIETVGNTTPRFDYDPVTLAPRGLLIEEQRTNLVLYSQQFDDAYWVKTQMSVTANATLSPDGTTAADTIIPNTTNTFHDLRSAANISLAASANVLSIYVKAAGYNFIEVGVSRDGSFGAYATAVIDLTNGTNAGTGVNLSWTTNSVSVQNAGNGWYRVSLAFTPNISTTTGMVFATPIPTSTRGVAFAGNGTSGAFLYGAQLEAGSFATSYIPTVASTVTRNADVATMTGTNFSSWFNQTEGTFVADVLDNAAGVNVLVASDGTTTNQLIMTSSTLNIFSVFTGGAFQAMLGVTPPAPYKSTGAYKVNDFAAAANGGTVSTDTSGTLATYSRLSIGANAVSNAAFLNGHIRTIAYFNTRLPNAQLQTLTAPLLATTLHVDFTSGSYLVGF